MRKAALATAALIPVLIGPLATQPADAAGPVRMTYVQYDSPGTDTGSNKSLNGEWVRIKNFRSTRKNLTGWTLRDTSHHVYRFGTFRLPAGASVRIHTGKGTNTRTNRYWGASWYVWNNTGDKAILRNKSGTTVDTCKWGSNGSGGIRC